jgi:2-polyprenyl-6-methoxyphenol hydroxylase-like FAD-dependent oxidoreductase
VAVKNSLIMNHYNIIIIGNRMAAAAALVSFGQRLADLGSLNIGLVAPRQSSAKHPVGESLPPTVKPLLQQMGLWDDFCRLDYPCSEVRFTSWENAQLQPAFARQTPYGFGWCVDRGQFEQQLWQQAEQTPFERIEAVFKHAEKCQSGWQLTLSTGQTLTTDFVLDCSGRAASFAKTQGERQKGSQMVALCDFLTPLNQEVQRSRGVMIEAVEQGWWYSSLLPDGHLAIAYFTNRDIIANDDCRDIHRWQQHLENSNYTRLRVETGEFSPVNQPTLHDASMSYQHPCAGDNWLACGDAALSVDPLSAHGMTTALWSGFKGANACLDALLGDHQPLQQYAQSCQTNWQLYCQQRQDIYRRQSRFADSPFWQQNAS